MDWVNLTDADTERLIDSIELAESFARKLGVFRSGLIAPDLREYQLAAHEAFDKMSAREREVFIMRTQTLSFPMIAEALEISVSSAKTYWRRGIQKCKILFQETDE